MLAPHSVYLDHHPIPIVFDASDPEQAEVLRAFQASFGERHILLEDLDPPRHVCLVVFPGGALEAVVS